MRIWSIHPAQLDRAALVSCWRETLLAQAVLAGRTKGYRQHPQLQRWRALNDPLAGIIAYLHLVADEADRRGYRFDRGRVDAPAPVEVEPMRVTTGQLSYEWDHLLAKVRHRDETWVAVIDGLQPRPHPMMTVVEGPIEIWEVVK
ncbi:pyrimidine dimer DNA glycosylase/endonuclease V [Calidifontibacter terrae]